MEVLTFFSSEELVFKQFEGFLFSYKLLKLENEDIDTYYFGGTETEKIEVLYHFVANDFEYEFSYNYIESDKQTVLNYFGDKKFEFIDLSYRSESFLLHLMRDFFIYSEFRKEDYNTILFSHPFKGFVNPTFFVGG